ncbi:twin-arginine translocase subunit TatC [Calidifontibacillus oryziterrae]|uniref:twin-arginine translocase subunit TatC n=1 Tax=Calidifontibacillus oryziterrae TaxID=1191699 RepID=UPI0002F51232|nr:twin-arginine translocase subunit TatC [Calidifontibacillus oryziterrae]
MEQQDKNMNLVGHLDELRNRIIVAALAFIVFFITAFIFVKDIYDFFVRDLDFQLTVLSPTEIIIVYFKIAGVVAIAATIPVIAWQLWLFIKPALKPLERKVTLSYIPALFVLFIVGLCFGYFFIFPIVFDFLVTLAEDMQNMFTIEKYFQFLLRVTLPFAILFELPVVVMFLTSLGIINPPKLVKIRKYAYFILVIVSATVTPPDLLMQTLVMIPMFILYEASISMSKIVYRKKLAKEKKLAEEYGLTDSEENDKTAEGKSSDQTDQDGKETVDSDVDGNDEKSNKE